MLGAAVGEQPSLGPLLCFHLPPIDADGGPNATSRPGISAALCARIMHHLWGLFSSLGLGVLPPFRAKGGILSGYRRQHAA
jgi:hypothetical protein